MNETLDKSSPDYIERILIEKKDLDDKCNKLGVYRNSVAFTMLSWRNQELLNTQAHIMTMYSAILSERIREFLESKNESKV